MIRGVGPTPRPSHPAAPFHQGVAWHLGGVRGCARERVVDLGPADSGARPTSVFEGSCRSPPCTNTLGRAPRTGHNSGDLSPAAGGAPTVISSPPHATPTRRGRSRPRGVSGRCVYIYSPSATRLLCGGSVQAAWTGARMEGGGVYQMGRGAGVELLQPQSVPDTGPATVPFTTTMERWMQASPHATSWCRTPRGAEAWRSAHWSSAAGVSDSAPHARATSKALAEEILPQRAPRRAAVGENYSK